jgi:phage FluMu protein Com
MNFRCTICNAVVARTAGQDRCPECGARAVFQIPTTESPRHAPGAGAAPRMVWEISPEGPRLRRLR